MNNLDFDMMLVSCVMVSAIASDDDEIYRNNIPGTDCCLISGGNEPGVIALYNGESDEVVMQYDTTETSLLEICLDVKDRLNRYNFE